MTCRVNLRKVTFHHHLKSLDVRAVASRVANFAMKASYRPNNAYIERAMFTI